MTAVAWSPGTGRYTVTRARAVLVGSILPAVPDLGFGAAHELTWQDQGVCAEADPDAWFPEKGGSNREAKRICRICPVRAECLEYALEHDQRFGIWGGTSERERRPMFAAREAGAA
jgi:WhiB family redox-sensing transcriptional regulator